MEAVVLVLMILTVLLFFLAMIGVGHPRINMVAAGLFTWALAVLLPLIAAM